jgi:hypothetical protein
MVRHEEARAMVQTSRLAAIALALALVGAARAERPVLEGHRGRYFGWAAPPGWAAQESTNGVTLRSPDGRERAGFLLLLRSPGASTPRAFVLRFLPMDPSYRIVAVESERRLPDLPGGLPGVAWQVSELSLRLLVDGVPHRALFTCAVKNAFGQFDAFLSYLHAVEPAWPAARQWLPQLTRGITIVNPGQVAMNDQLLRPRNNPLDNSGLLESWRRKGLSEDRISQARREGTMGYERMKDASTGRMYDMPFETYDGTAGGYRNPVRPGELLVKARPGE